jgi:oligopeptide transport system substrate-binding protein
VELSRRRRGLLLGPLLCALLACGEATGAGGVSLDPTQALRFAVEADAGTVDPAQTALGLGAEIDRNLFSGLLRVDDLDGGLAPDIAQAMPDVSADGTTYTFKLRKGVRFSNADPVTAADFVYSWTRATALRGPMSFVFDQVDRYQAVDDRTLTVQLKAPSASFLWRITLAPAAAVDQKVVVADAGWASRPQSLVGTGAYRMVARDPGKSMRFAPVAEWWGSPKPALRDIKLDVTPDVAAAFSAYQQHRLDALGLGWEPLTPEIALQLRDDARSNLHSIPGPGSTWVGFNFSRGPFVGMTGGPRQLRQALALAIDRATLGVQLCAHNLACVGARGGLIPSGLRGYLGAGQDPLATYDPGLARQLLSAGDPDRSRLAGLSYAFPDTSEQRLLADALKSQWQQTLDLAVVLQPVPAAEYATRRNRGDFVLFAQSWRARYNHPQDWYDNLFMTGAARAVGFSDPALDHALSLADASSRGSDTSRYTVVAQTLIGDAAYIPLFYDVRNVAARTYLRNSGATALSDRRWAYVEVLQHD